MVTFSTRAEAVANGANRYNTGKPCVNGHLSDRYVVGACVACQAMHAAGAKGKRAIFRAENKDALSAANAEYRSRNQVAISERRKANYHRVSEKARHRAAKWYAENRDRALAQCADWASRNPSVVKAARHKYKAKRRAAYEIRLSDFDDFAVKEACDLAARRERALGGKWHVDHMVPLFARNVCGLHVAANLAVIPASVNVRKQNKLILTTPGAWLRAV